MLISCVELIVIISDCDGEVEFMILSGYFLLLETNNPLTVCFELFDN